VCYQHQNLAVEVTNSAKAKLLSFNGTDIFLCDVVLYQKMTFLKRASAVGDLRG